MYVHVPPLDDLIDPLRVEVRELQDVPCEVVGMPSVAVLVRVVTLRHECEAHLLESVMLVSGRDRAKKKHTKIVT